MANVHIRGGEQSCKSESLQKLKKKSHWPQTTPSSSFFKPSIKNNDLCSATSNSSDVIGKSFFLCNWCSLHMVLLLNCGYSHYSITGAGDRDNLHPMFPQARSKQAHFIFTTDLINIKAIEHLRKTFQNVSVKKSNDGSNVSGRSHCLHNVAWKSTSVVVVVFLFFFKFKF